MSELQLKSTRFREEREAGWRRLEALLTKVEKGSAAALSDEDLLAIPVLYRAALSSLSVARTISLDRGLLDYLESLCARAYFVVYGVRGTIWSSLGRFFLDDWPAAARALWKETAVAALLMLLGTLVGYGLVSSQPEWFDAFVAPALANGRDPSASAATLRATLYAHQTQGLPAFAAFLFTHNAGVSLVAFATGFAFGLPTAFMVVSNGCMMGAFLALFAAKGLGFQAGGWLGIHGVTEISAVILASAAGFHIGWATAFPGEKARLDAAAAAGRRAGALMGGVLVMLVCAGLLEGLGRQLIQDDWTRYAIAGATAVLWPAYLYLFRGPRTKLEQAGG
ncbi:MAG: stage II sporulation protein M [Caulobacteraceae bacterium]